MLLNSENLKENTTIANQTHASTKIIIIEKYIFINIIFQKHVWVRAYLSTFKIWGNNNERNAIKMNRSRWIADTVFVIIRRKMFIIHNISQI